MNGLNAYGLRAARKLLKETSARMKGDRSDYARGYRASLQQLDTLITVHLNEISARALAERK